MTGLRDQSDTPVDHMQSQPLVGNAPIDPFGDRNVKFEAGEFVHKLPIVPRDGVVMVKDEKIMAEHPNDRPSDIPETLRLPTDPEPRDRMIKIYRHLRAIYAPGQVPEVIEGEDK